MKLTKESYSVRSYFNEKSRFFRSDTCVLRVYNLLFLNGIFRLSGLKLCLISSLIFIFLIFTDFGNSKLQKRNQSN
ncbi:MAG: hypothetical protein RL517_1555 [Pseudomonadota bacterium]